jgi:hypothetical protein
MCTLWWVNKDVEHIGSAWVGIGIGCGSRVAAPNGSLLFHLEHGHHLVLFLMVYEIIVVLHRYKRCEAIIDRIIYLREKKDQGMRVSYHRWDDKVCGRGHGGRGHRAWACGGLGHRVWARVSATRGKHNSAA